MCLTDLEKLPLTWKTWQGRRHSRDRLVPLPSATKSHRLSLFLCFSTCEWRHGEGRDRTKNSAKLKNMGALGIDRDLVNHKAPQILYSLKMKHL